jgi:hypothetical protein
MALGAGRGARRTKAATASPVTVACLMLLALVPNPAFGQERMPERRVDQLEVGDSVRLRVTGALRLDGALRGVRGDTLVLRVEGLRGLWPVSSSDLVTLHRYTERNPREGFRHGAMTGLMIGLFAGAAVGVAVEASRSHEDSELTSAMIRSVLRWGGGGAGIGAATGGILGGANPGRGWVALTLPTR